MFAVDEGTPIPIKVPMDGISPYIVNDPKMTVDVLLEGGRLRIQLLKPTYEGLADAMQRLANTLLVSTLPPSGVLSPSTPLNRR